MKGTPTLRLDVEHPTRGQIAFGQFGIATNRSELGADLASGPRPDFATGSESLGQFFGQLAEGALSLALNAVVGSKQFQQFLGKEGITGSSQYDGSVGRLAQVVHQVSVIVDIGIEFDGIHIVNVANGKPDDFRLEGFDGVLWHPGRLAVLQAVPLEHLVPGRTRGFGHQGQAKGIDAVRLFGQIAGDQEDPRHENHPNRKWDGKQERGIASSVNFRGCHKFPGKNPTILVCGQELLACWAMACEYLLWLFRRRRRRLRSSTRNRTVRYEGVFTRTKNGLGRQKGNRCWRPDLFCHLR
jgi:hypothetical protein